MGKAPKGTISTKDIKDDGVTLTALRDFSIRAGNRTYPIQAPSPSIAEDWVKAIKDWIKYHGKK